MKKITLILIFNSTFFIFNNSFAQTIAGGWYHSLALCSDSTVRTWGWNIFGMLGNGTNTDSNVPVQVGGLSGITAIAGGEYHSLALQNDGTVWAWGEGYWGQLGNGTNADSNVPVQASAPSAITAIEAGWQHSLALKNDGTVWVWGLNHLGQLGNGSYTNSYVPVQVSTLSGVIAIAGGSHFSLALKNDGTVWAWGYNDAGQLGNGTNNDTSNVPIQVNALSGVTAIAGGYLHSLALKNDGTLWAWGANYAGQLGNGTSNDSNVPIQVSALSGVTAIAAGGEFSLALRNDGTVWGWGRNVDGQLGTGIHTDSSNVPVQMGVLSGITAIAAGGSHTLALKNDGTLWSCGDNYRGQLGIGTNWPDQQDSPVPVQVTGLCPVLIGVEEENIISVLNIFPNPSTDELRIENADLPAGQAGLKIKEIEIYSSLGEKVFEHQTSDVQHLTISVADFPPGIYFITVTDEAGNKVTKKVVKM